MVFLDTLATISMQVFLKPLLPALENSFLGWNYTKRAIMDHTQNKKHFFGRNNKSRSSLFRNILYNLSKYHMFWLSYESFSILSDVFCQKSVMWVNTWTCGLKETKNDQKICQWMMYAVTSNGISNSRISYIYIYYIYIY